MNKYASIALLTVVASLVTLPAQAIDTVIYAPVVRVYPIKQTEIHRQPHDKCYREQVVVPAQPSATGTVLGGIVGAALGSKLGHGSSNRRLGAVAGGVLGATVGHDISQSRAQAGVRTQDICETEYDEYSEERVVGYEVQYRYNGHTYTTRTDHHPGDTIRLRVNAYPDE